MTKTNGEKKNGEEGDGLRNNNLEFVRYFKALADETLLKIVTLLAGREMCACELLENFPITQPTLSYHMKILCDSQLVNGWKEGAWMHYKNNPAVFEKLKRFSSECQSLSLMGSEEEIMNGNHET